MSSGETTDIAPTTTLSPKFQEEDDPVDHFSPLFDETPVELPVSLDSVDRAELLRLQQSDPDLAGSVD